MGCVTQISREELLALERARDIQHLRHAVLQGGAQEAGERIRNLLALDTDPEVVLKQALIAAMDEVGDLFQKGETYMPEMLMAARTMHQALEVLKPVLVRGGVAPAGKVVIGTVRGDLHDIGRKLVAMSLEGAGFEVVDLGTDVPAARFVEAIREHAPQVVGMSALLTTTMLSMKDTFAAIAGAGLRDRVSIMIGGAPITRQFADEIGADFYGPDSTAAKDFARQAIRERLP
jgi:5-methyltetrahydrofolate--homocysteine methyltransferase